MTSPARFDLVVHEENDFILDCQLLDADGDEVDITGYSFELEFLASDVSTGAVAAVSGSIVTAAEGLFRFVVPSASTADWSTRRGVFEVRAVDTLGYIRTIGEGQFTYNYWGVA